MKLHSTLSAAAALLGAATPTLAISSRVRLPYATYHGVQLGKGITQWLGMRYAAPPTGARRFRPPEEPLEETEELSAAAYGDRCLVTGSAAGAAGHSEDCLFINVYAPNETRTTGPFLPVLVWLGGDGYANAQTDADINATGLLQANDGNFVVVTFNHRLGPYGFLASGHTLGTNNGLRDQVRALEWVRRFIRRFGGDPEQVTLGGSGIAAQYVMAHLIMHKDDSPHFNAVIAESPSFAPMRDLDEAATEYHRFAQQLGCERNSSSRSHNATAAAASLAARLAIGDDAKTLACLLALDADAIQEASRQLALSTVHAAPWDRWVPVIDHDLVSKTTSQSLAAGHFARVPFLFGSTVAAPGTAFAYRNRSSTDSVTSFMHDLYPFLQAADLAEMEALYTTSACGGGGGDPACFQNILARIDQDLRYTCPTLAAVGRLRDGGVKDAYLYSWDVDGADDTDGDLGAHQNTEAAALWGGTAAAAAVPNSYRRGGANEAVPLVKQRYWANFVRSHNPNRAHKKAKGGKNEVKVGERVVGLAKWGSWSPGKRTRLVLGNGGVTGEKSTAHLRFSCTFFDRMAPRMRV